MSETAADPSEQRSDETTEEWERRNREAAQATPEAPPSEHETTSSDPYA